MKKTFILFSAIIFSTIILNGCAVKEAIDDSVDAIECANLLERIDNEEGNRPCSEQIADIEQILRTCDEFLSQDQKDDLNFAVNNCTDD
ncbi:MAG: hypothetical protein WBB27_01250 [Maribacter sp.]|jgi:hypothetical protein